MIFRPKIPFKWKGNHHLYYGIFFSIFGLFNWYMGIDNAELETLLPIWKYCIGIGMFMIIDDIWEHTISADTPLRIIYDKVIKQLLVGK